MASIIEFIKKGNLGPLKLGCKKEYIRGLLGEPEQTSESAKWNCIIWKYGSLEIHFKINTAIGIEYLNSITIEYWYDHEFKFPSALNLEGWIPDHETTMEEFLNHSSSSGILLAQDKDLSFIDDAFYLISEIGVSIIFSKDIDTEQPFLSKISYSKELYNSEKIQRVFNEKKIE
ncbi:hypothetical protein ACFL02_06950 [Planctomycetota bacterium]